MTIEMPEREPSMPHIELRPSAIEGLGAFSAESIRAGGVILRIDDSRVVADLAVLTPYQRDHECDFLGSTTILMQDPEKRINHSCEPNAYVKTTRGARYVFALRDIHAGEEITCDYAVNGYYDSDTACHCGSPICRGTIDPDFFKLPLRRQKEYLPYLDAWFVERFKAELKNLRES